MNQTWLHVIEIVIGVAILALFTVKYMQPNDKTILKAGATEIIYQTTPNIPIVGCSIWKVRLEAVYNTGIPQTPQKASTMVK